MQCEEPFPKWKDIWHLSANGTLLSLTQGCRKGGLPLLAGICSPSLVSVGGTPEVRKQAFLPAQAQLTRLSGKHSATDTYWRPGDWRLGSPCRC